VNGDTINGKASNHPVDTLSESTTTGTTTSQTLSTSPSSLSLGGTGKDSVPTPATIPDPPTTDSKPKPDDADKTKKEEDDPKKRRGWPSRYPFSRSPYQDLGQPANKDDGEGRIFWSELSFSEKTKFRKQFLREYLSESKLCLPYVRKLFLMICRLSPWRAATILILNIVNGLLPALTLQTRGNFIMMVFPNLVGLMVVANGNGEGDFKSTRVDTVATSTACGNGVG
jgi:hypothetical protein